MKWVTKIISDNIISDANWWKQDLTLLWKKRKKKSQHIQEPYQKHTNTYMPKKHRNQLIQRTGKFQSFNLYANCLIKFRFYPNNLKGWKYHVRLRTQKIQFTCDITRWRTRSDEAELSTKEAEPWAWPWVACVWTCKWPSCSPSFSTSPTPFWTWLKWDLL